jgi:hypothetical protein
MEIRNGRTKEINTKIRNEAELGGSALFLIRNLKN